ncbi:MAG: HNH endonuclease signature motif containing protein [Alphaproteobacteria bacterium]
MKPNTISENVIFEPIQAKDVSSLKMGVTPDGQRIFLYDTREQLIQPIMLCSEEETKALREQYEKDNKIQRDFVKYLARQGVLELYFSKAYCRVARRRGTRPRGFQIHHIIPLSLGGTNDFSNLMLVHEDIHMEIHERIWDGIYKMMKEAGVGSTAMVILPVLPPVMNKADICQLMSVEQLRQKMTAEKCRKQRDAYRNSTSKQCFRQRIHHIRGGGYDRGR